MEETLSEAEKEIVKINGEASKEVINNSTDDSKVIENLKSSKDNIEK